MDGDDVGVIQAACRAGSGENAGRRPGQLERRG